MLKIDVRMDIDKLRRDIDHIRTDQIPFATAMALNEVAVAAVAAVQTEMRAVFDRPTSFTIRGYRVLQRANKRAQGRYGLFAVVGFAEAQSVRDGGARSAGSYLQPHMDAGPRRAKGLERLLAARGLIGANEFLVPSKFQPLDQYGNVPRSVIQKVLANLSAFHDALQHTPKGGARGGKKKGEYFFTRRGIRGAQLTAIWRRTSAGNAVPAFIVVTGAPKYRKRFDPTAVVERTKALHFNAAFESAYARAVATAR